MDNNKYLIFLEVAKQQNLSRAAEVLGYTQSGISHTLKRLENEMDLILFERSKNGAVLTSAGKEVYPFIAKLVQCQENLDQTILSLHNLHRGTLNIGTYSSISREWLPYIIQKFKQDYPSVKIHFKEGGNEDIIRWIKNREVDLGFLSSGFKENIEWIPLKEDPLMAILPPDYDTGGQTHFRLKDFNGQTFIISALGTDIDIHNTLEKYHIRPDIQYSAKDDYTIISMVACHLGISILPNLVLNKYDQSVITMPLKPYAKRELGIAIASRDSASPSALEFIEYAKQFVQQS
ncbi:MAG: LysR family transcriptional regulator [Lachnospiraceae bacterium]|nr:LysR family transcriptional regulator [Lachnospiraceae bacterium]